MSWKLKRALEEQLGREQGNVVKDWGGKASIALVYPNTYPVGMGNLAVHTLYKLFNDQPNLVCERAFIPDKKALAEHRRTDTPVLSMESRRPLADFDAITFTISFENDYLNILPILDMAKIPARACDRKKGHPILIVGGAAPTLNPKPLSEIFDVIVPGDAECFIDELSQIILEKRCSKKIFAKKIAPDLNAFKTQTTIYSPDAEFGHMHLIEVERGCPYRCKFCAVPEIYSKARVRNVKTIIEMIEDGLKFRKKFGLIGAHILTLPNFRDIASHIHSLGASFSPSSVRVEEITHENAQILAKSGHKSLALGIEAGSQNLRKTLGKNFTNDKILNSVEIMANEGITNLRLYFMVGLPNETEKDINSIAALAREISETLDSYAPKTARKTSIGLTLTAFVPKPGTDFKNEQFAGVKSIKEKFGALKNLLASSKSIDLNFENPIDSQLEYVLSNADTSVLPLLQKAYELGSAKQALMAR